MGKNAVSLVIGGFVAYAGVLVFFAGIASIIAYLFERGGMNLSRVEGTSLPPSAT